MYKICFFVPINDADSVKSAMFSAGAGKIGFYEHCSFESLGTGQFKALKGAHPTLGEIGVLEKVQELKVEMICPDECLKEVIEEMKKNHPYEMPAFDIIKLIDL